MDTDRGWAFGGIRRFQTPVTYMHIGEGIFIAQDAALGSPYLGALAVAVQAR